MKSMLHFPCCQSESALENIFCLGAFEKVLHASSRMKKSERKFYFTLLLLDEIFQIETLKKWEIKS